MKGSEKNETDVKWDPGGVGFEVNKARVHNAHYALFALIRIQKTRLVSPRSCASETERRVRALRATRDVI